MYKVSVVIPCYNSSSYVEECINSALNQTLSNVQVIVVDDGSTDTSLEIIKKFSKHKNLKIISFPKNRGVGAARNEAIKYARGEFIGFLDSDDFVDKEMYEKMYNFAKSKNLEMAICGIHFFSSKGTIQNLFFDDNADIGNASVQVHRCYASRIISRDFWNKNGLNFWDRKFEDVHLYAQYFNIIKSYGYLQEPLYHYRRGHKSISGKSVSINWMDLFYAEICVYLKVPTYGLAATILNDLSIQFICSIRGLYFLAYLKAFLMVRLYLKDFDYKKIIQRGRIQQRIIYFLSAFLATFLIRDVDIDAGLNKLNDLKKDLPFAAITIRREWEE